MRRESFAVVALALCGGCQVNTRSTPPTNSAAAAHGYAMAPPPAPLPRVRSNPRDATGTPPAPESFHASSLRQPGTALLNLPGTSSMQLVKYDLVDGMAVMEGDILLGAPAQLPFRYGLPKAPAGNVKSAVALVNREHFWPGGQIPYVIDASAASQTETINAAIQHLNQTALKVRPRTTADADFLVFKATGGDCSSFLGRVGGPQDVQVGGCSTGSVVHEMMHAAGFYHEQSRGDRDEHITIVFSEIDPANVGNFEKRDDRGQDIGPYDYGSIMHYSSRAFSRTGRPTIIPKVANAQIGQRDGLSPLDLAAIAELYGPPTGTSTTPAQTPTPQQPAPAPQAASGSFAGNYTSSRGDVTCSETQFSVDCRFPGGAMLCGARGDQLECAWNGGGQGRAIFRRQANGVLAGTFGDFLSADSRGRWDLIPAGAAAPAPQSTPQPTPAPSATVIPFAGNYSSTRGAMACNESGSVVTCSFQEQGANGRLDCLSDGSGLKLSCTWATFLPRPASGRAEFTRPSIGDRNLTGTFGFFTATSGGGTWNAQHQ